MARQWLGFILFLSAIPVLAASGDLGALPVLLPCAALSGYLIVRYSSRRTALSLEGNKR